MVSTSLSFDCESQSYSHFPLKESEDRINGLADMFGLIRVLMIVVVILGVTGFYGFGATFHYQTNWFGPVAVRNHGLYCPLRHC